MLVENCLVIKTASLEGEANNSGAFAIYCYFLKTLYDCYVLQLLFNCAECHYKH